MDRKDIVYRNKTFKGVPYRTLESEFNINFDLQPILYTEGGKWVGHMGKVTVRHTKAHTVYSLLLINNIRCLHHE